MSAANFKVEDENYIYVPMIFFNEDSIDDPLIINDEIGYIIFMVTDKVREYLMNEFDSRDECLDFSILDEDYGNEITISLITEDDYIENTINIHFNRGYYSAGNISYSVDWDSRNPEFLDRIVNNVCILIEDELRKYCYRYVSYGTASNGETFYKRIT